MIPKDRMERFYSLFEGFLRKIEVDRAVLFGLLTRVWQMFAVPVTVFLIATRFIPELQGYYYTFESLLKLQIFVELGLGIVITQFASHEWSKLRLDKTGQIVGEASALSRLVSLARIAVRWYFVGSIILTIGLGLGGYIFFSLSPDIAIDWTAQWLILCLFTGINICLFPIWSLLEGCNQVESVYFCRLIQALCGYLAIWLAIMLGAGLWTLSIFSAVGLICAVFYLYKNFHTILVTLLFSRQNGPQVSWYSEIWPMQWRIGLSWASGYFIFFIITPIIFHYHGPVVAGQMGMTLSITGALLAICSAWVSPSAPLFGLLVAQREYKKLDNLFWRLTKVVTGVAVLGAFSILVLVYALNSFKYPIANRILPLLPTALFLLATVVIAASLPMSTYLRAHKKEPLLLLSLINGILIGISNLILGKYFSATGISVGFLFANLLIFPFIILVWYRCRKAWHI